MIITQTPLRVSLFGGGTDFPEFFRQDGGAILSLGIDKYVHVIAKERFDDDIYVNYSQKEIVSSVDDVQHDLVREALRKAGITGGIEVTTLADVPSHGTGLGSSSSVTVGLLNAFYAYQGEQVGPERLAREACEIELDILGKPMGVQDQYIAAYGNLRFFDLRRDGGVGVEKVPVSEQDKRRLVSNILLFFTGKTRSASNVLTEQRKNIDGRLPELRKLRDMAHEARSYVVKSEFDHLGEMLHESWQAKKRLASNISNGDIDGMYERALAAGALGGKIAGAGSGGFLLLYVPRERQAAVRESLKGYRELPFMLSRDGSKVIFNQRSYEWK